MKKQCSCCKQLKNINEFHKDIKTKDKLRCNCKECHCKSAQKSKINYRNRNKIKQMVIKEKYCPTCKQILSFLQFTKHLYSKDGLFSCCRTCRKKKRSSENERKKASKYVSLKYKTDILFRLKCIIRRRTRNALKGKIKNISVTKNIGCSIECLKIYLESKFYNNPITKEKMTWDNYGYSGWHIDHIVPLSNFNLTVPSEMKLACHYTNPQPLWAQDHINKHSTTL